MAWTQEKIEEVAKSIQDKAMTDMKFRTRFKTDPNTVIEEVSGLQVPAGFTIRVIAPEDADLTVTLPEIKNDELSDMELEEVAGGKGHPHVDNHPNGATPIDNAMENIGNSFKNSF